MSQTAVCNRFHSAEQQLCRWLLLSHDRVSSNELVMTQELIADRLGVCREAVSHEAARLQTAGLVSYHRGHILILDRSGLEERVCECYGVVRAECERLMGQFPREEPRVAGACGCNRRAMLDVHYGSEADITIAKEHV